MYCFIKVVSWIKHKYYENSRPGIFINKGEGSCYKNADSWDFPHFSDS